MRSSSSSTFTSSKWTLTGSCGRQRLLPLEFASAPRGISGSGCCFGRRARACGSFAGGAIFWAFCHIYYTTAVTTRAARWKQAGRPLQGTPAADTARVNATLPSMDDDATAAVVGRATEPRTRRQCPLTTGGPIPTRTTARATAQSRDAPAKPTATAAATTSSSRA